MVLNYTDISSPTEFVGLMNTESNGLLGIGILLSLAVIIFMSLKSRGYDTPVCATASMFATMITSILLLALGWIADKAILMTISLFVASFIWMSMTHKRS